MTYRHSNTQGYKSQPRNSKSKSVEMDLEIYTSICRLSLFKGVWGDLFQGMGLQQVEIRDLGWTFWEASRWNRDTKVWNCVKKQDRGLVWNRQRIEIISVLYGDMIQWRDARIGAMWAVWLVLVSSLPAAFCMSYRQDRATEKSTAVTEVWTIKRSHTIKIHKI